MRVSPTLELAESVERARRSGREAYSFSTPTFESLNPELLSRIRFRTTLTGAKGGDDLRAAARAALFGKWALPGHECALAGGAKAAIFSILRSMTSPGGKVLIVSPHWPSYEDLAIAAGLVPAFFETSLEQGYSIERSRLRQALDQSGAKALICSNPGNPTGRILTRRELESLCAEASNSGASLLLDESFSRIVFNPGKWADSVCEAGTNLFIVNSFSKNFHLQGLRLGAFLAPVEHMPAVAAMHQTVLSSAPSPSQDIALAILDSEDAARTGYAEQRLMVLDFLTSRGWRHLATEGSFYVFPKVGATDEVRARLENRGVMTLPGSVFGLPYAEHLRICFGKPVSEIEAILRLTRHALA